MKEVSEYHDCLPGAATTELATGSFYIGDDYANSPDIAALEVRIAKLDVDHDLVVSGNIQVEKRISALEKDVTPSECLAEPGPCKADDQAPFTAAQLIALSRDINSTVMTILDPMIDLVIDKVNDLPGANVKNILTPYLQASELQNCHH